MKVEIVQAIDLKAKPGPMMMRRADVAAIIKSLLLARDGDDWQEALLLVAVACDLNVVYRSNSNGRQIEAGHHYG